MQQQIREKIKKAIRKDFKNLYQKEYTTNWKEQRFIRDIEIGVMIFNNLEHLLQQQRDEDIKKIEELDCYYVGDSDTPEIDYLKKSDVITTLKKE